ncbi:MAG TPA: hypothetical protein VJU18_11720 [Vicinamibacteria bacterium]|nr:hypothetical protein [Vicinamibacteria bacterium]
MSPSVASEAARTAPAAVTAAAAPRPAPIHWRKCSNHPQVRSEAMCPACKKGYCSECGQRVQRAVICPACDGLCIKSEQFDQDLRRDAQKSRNMFEDLGTVLAYPLRDPLSYVLLALFTWVFGVAARFAMYGGLLGVLLSQGVLMWYAFTALTRVANGNLKDSMPEFRDIWDIVKAFLLGICASVVSSGPLFAVAFLIPGVAFLSQMNRAEVPAAVAVAHAQPPEEPPAEQPAEEGEPGGEAPEETEAAPTDSQPPGGKAPVPGGDMATLAGVALGFLALAGLALIWKIVYEPVALTVAGLSHSYGQTLNPLVGIDTIRKMGGVYWQAWLIYCILSAVQWVIGLLLSAIPILGGIVLSFVNAYVYLAIGCLMGLAVFKKAKELDWD